jgi:hypothetical protein
MCAFLSGFGSDAMRCWPEVVRRPGGGALFHQWVRKGGRPEGEPTVQAPGAGDPSRGLQLHRNPLPQGRLTAV